MNRSFFLILLGLVFIIINNSLLYATNCSCGCSCEKDCECGCQITGECNCNGQEEPCKIFYDQNCVTCGDPCCPFCEPLNDCDFTRKYDLRGIWLPEDKVLFEPLVADPRQVCYSVGWRFNDDALSKNVIDVSFGDSIAFYRWCGLWFGVPGDAQIELEGAVWAVFNPCVYSAPLLNADYYVGGLLTWAYNEWSARLRFYHISSHLGDEFLLNHPGFCRKNPSAEYLDLFVSYWITRDIRLYGGVGYVMQEDPSFHIARWYGAAGAELHFTELRFVSWANRLYGEPFYGMYFRFSKDFKNHLDSTYVLGYEWAKLSGIGRKVRVFVEYHNGYSLEGQFYHRPTSYLSVRLSYGF